MFSLPIDELSYTLVITTTDIMAVTIHCQGCRLTRLCSDAVGSTLQHFPASDLATTIDFGYIMCPGMQFVPHIYS